MTMPSYSRIRFSEERMSCSSSTTRMQGLRVELIGWVPVTDSPAEENNTRSGERKRIETAVGSHTATAHPASPRSSGPGLPKCRTRPRLGSADLRHPEKDVGLPVAARGQDVELDRRAGFQPAQRVLLLDRGRFVGLLHSLTTAAQMQAQPTGHGRVGALGMRAMPRMSNTYVDRGEYDPEEIIRSVRKGFYAHKF